MLVKAQPGGNVAVAVGVGVGEGVDDTVSVGVRVPVGGSAVNVEVMVTDAVGVGDGVAAKTADADVTMEVVRLSALSGVSVGLARGGDGVIAGNRAGVCSVSMGAAPTTDSDGMTVG